MPKTAQNSVYLNSLIKEFDLESYIYGLCVGEDNGEIWEDNPLHFFILNL